MVRLVLEVELELYRTVHQVLRPLIVNPKTVIIVQVVGHGVVGVRTQVQIVVKKHRPEPLLIVYLKTLQMVEMDVHIQMEKLKLKQGVNGVDVTEFWILIKNINIY